MFMSMLEEGRKHSFPFFMNGGPGINVLIPGKHNSERGDYDSWRRRRRPSSSFSLSRENFLKERKGKGATRNVQLAPVTPNPTITTTTIIPFPYLK
jgi:hypothetical protein